MIHNKLARIEKKLQQIDKIIDHLRLEANTERLKGNDLRASYLEGEADGLARAYGLIIVVFDGEE